MSQLNSCGRCGTHKPKHHFYPSKPKLCKDCHDKDVNKRNQRKESAKCEYWTKQAIIATMEYFDYKCAFCDVDLPKSFKPNDHALPISSGGRTTPGNMIPLCQPCNHMKYDRTIQDLDYLGKGNLNDLVTSKEPQHNGMQISRKSFITNLPYYLIRRGVFVRMKRIGNLELPNPRDPVHYDVTTGGLYEDSYYAKKVDSDGNRPYSGSIDYWEKQLSDLEALPLMNGRVNPGVESQIELVKNKLSRMKGEQ